MNAVSSIAASAAAYVPMTTPQAGAESRNTTAVPDATAAASSEAQISPQAKALAEFFDAANAFIQQEHFEPFTGWKYSNGSSGYVLNYESAYLDVEKYNNYLFDKAATTLVEQAKQLGLALDKDEALAQLKADNANVAAIQYSYAERRKYLEMNRIVAYSGLTHTDVNSLTDLYITAKENGLDASQVGGVAFYLGIYYRDKSVIMMELYTVPGAFPSTAEEIAEHEAQNFARFQNKIDLAGELKAKLPNVRFGFDEESGFFEQFLNPRITLGGVNDDTLNFLLQIADLKASGPASDESWTWSPSTGWTTDPDSREAAAARSAYEGWLAKTAADLEKYFGDKSGKSGKAAFSSDEADESGELQTALARIAQEKEWLAQLLRPLTRPAKGEDDRRFAVPPA
jgi:hypothetical protein